MIKPNVPSTKEPIIYAEVIFDITHSVHKGSYLPAVIQKGYKTWFHIDYKRLIGTPSIIHPESNRWAANIPGIYFKEITKEEFESVNNYYLI